MRCVVFALLFAVFSSPTAFAQQEAPSGLETLTLDIHAVQIVLNDEHREGVDWEAIVSDFHSLPLKKEDNPVWADKKYHLHAGTVSNEDYAVLLDALDTVGKVTPLPQERVHLTADEPQTAALDLGEDKGQTISLHMRLVPGAKAALAIEPSVGIMYKDAGKTALLTLLWRILSSRSCYTPISRLISSAIAWAACSINALSLPSTMTRAKRSVPE